MFLFTPVTETEGIQVIKGLKNNSSIGFDETPTFLVKQCVCHFIKPLVHIFFSNSYFTRHDEKGKNKTFI